MVSEESSYRKAIIHPVHVTIAFLDLLDHVVASEAHLELFEPGFPTTLHQESGYL